MTTTATRLSFYLGTKRVLNLTVYDADNPTPNTPLDLAGRTVRFALSRVKADGNVSDDALIEKDAEIVSAPAGTCRVTLLRADTEALAAGRYWQEWEVFDGDGESDVVAVGHVTLRANVE